MSLSRTFLIVWVGQLVSLVGSGLTNFALGLWVYARTGSITQFALISVATTVPAIVLSPFAGVMIDRWDRRRAMMLADAGAGASMLAVAILLVAGQLSTPLLYLLLALSTAFATFQWPAYTAATTLLVAKGDLGRAGGMVQSAQAVAQIASPALGAALILVVPIGTLVFLDVATYVVALLSLIAVRFPAPIPTGVRATVWREAIAAWRYIADRRGLLGLLLLFTVSNFGVGYAQVLITPFLLALGTPQALGLTLSIGGSGMLLGGILMSVWGGPAKKMHAVLALQLVVAAMLAIIGLAHTIVIAGAALFGIFFAVPILIASTGAIWQQKTDPAMQGRVFAVRRMLSWGCMPIAYLTIGPATTALGMANVFLAIAAVVALATIVAGLAPRVRRVEAELADVVP